jgi:hypothetical protein
VRKKIKDLQAEDSNVEIMGTIVQVFDPKFFPIDKETGKRVTEKEGKFFLNDAPIDNVSYSYVTNLFLDDGTDSVRVVLWKNQAQRLFGMSDEEIVSKRNGSFEDLKNDLLGRIVKFIGRTSKNEMFDRIEFVPQLVINNPDPQEELDRLSKEIPVQAAKQEPPKPTDVEAPAPKKEKKESEEELLSLEDLEELEDLE